MYHRWGPSARNSIMFARDSLQEPRYETSVRRAAASFAQDPPLSSHGEALALIAGSHTLFCVRPMPGKNGFLSGISTVISPHVQLIIQEAVSREDEERRKQFYKIVSVHPHCRSAMGWLLEQQFHRWIGLDTSLQAPAKATFLKCVPSQNGLPALRLQPVREEQLNNVQELVNAESLLLPIYYRTTSEHLPGVDGLILTFDAVVLIQVTVSSAHALKKEYLVPLYNNLPASIRDRLWKFVWIVPERDIGEALAQRRFNISRDWPTISFYWCRLPFDTKASFWIRLSNVGTDVYAIRRVLPKA